MRFVLVGPSAPIRGGIAIENDALARALVQANHTVEQINFRRLYPGLFFPGRTQFDETYKPSELSTVRHCLDSLNPLNWWTTARIIAQLWPHRVTFQWWHPFFAPCYAALLLALKRTRPEVTRILISHNTRPHEPMPGQDLALQLVARLCNEIIVHARSEYELTTRLAPRSTVHIVDYPLLGTPRTLSSRPEAQQRLGVSGRVLLFLGYIRKYKGLDLLLQSLAQVSTNPPVSLLIAGEFYEPVQKYRELVHTLGLADRVRILNRYVPEAEWPDLFAATDALVLPYRAASQSMSIALAYEFGKPVIVSRVGGLAEAVEDGRTGLIAEPEPTALATAIQQLYNEFQVSPYHEHITARRQQLGWGPFLRVLTGNGTSHE